MNMKDPHPQIACLTPPTMTRNQHSRGNATSQLSKACNLLSSALKHQSEWGFVHVAKASTAKMKTLTDALRRPRHFFVNPVLQQGCGSKLAIPGNIARLKVPTCMLVILVLKYPLIN